MHLSGQGDQGCTAGDGGEAEELDWKGVVDYERDFRCRADSFAWNFQISSCSSRLR